MYVDSFKTVGTMLVNNGCPPLLTAMWCRFGGVALQQFVLFRRRTARQLYTISQHPGATSKECWKAFHAL
jgi:hypothetical protein